MSAAPAKLDMGIWSDDGTVWLPKALYPKRSEAKMFAVREWPASYIDVRCRTRWMRHAPDAPEAAYSEYEHYYVMCSKDDEGAFECWEIT